MKGILISLALLLVAVSDASVQSLAELAEREKERRESLGSTETETYDDAALAARRRATPPSMRSSEVPGGAATESGDAAASGGETVGVEEVVEDEDPTQTEAYWRDRKAAIDRRIAGIEAQLNQPGFASDPANLMRRNQLERQLQQARSDLAALRAEARSGGVPPGWVR